MLQQSDAQESEVCTFIREIWQYATIQELDETVLNRLISRILVGKVKNADGQKTQEVRIVYNFVWGGRYLSNLYQRIVKNILSKNTSFHYNFYLHQ